MRDYYRLCKTMPTDWLLANLEDPSPYQTKRHLRVIRLVILKRESIQP